MSGAFPISADDLRLGASNPGLEVIAGGLAFKVAEHLELVVGGARLKSAAVGNGLTGGGATTTVSILSDDASLTVDGSGVRVALNDASLVLGGSGVGVQLADNSIELAGGGVQVKKGIGLAQDANGLYVNKIMASWTQVSNYTPTASDSKDNVDTEIDTAAGGNNSAQTAFTNAGVFVDASADYGAGGATLPTSGTQVTQLGTAGAVVIRNKITKDAIDDGAGNEVYGVLFYNTNDSAFYMRFFSDVSDTQTLYVWGGTPPALDIVFPEMDTFDNIPAQAMMGLGGNFIDIVAGDITAVTAGDGLSGGGTSGAVSVAVDLDTNPGLEINSAKLRAKIKANSGIVRDADGLSVGLATNPALQFTAGNIELLIAANEGLTKDAGGLKTVLDTGTSGQLSKGASGLRVATGNAGMPVKAEAETYLATAFTWATPISTKTVTATPATGTNLDKAQRLTKSGLDNMTRVAAQPAATGEWRLNGTTLEIFGDITGEPDTYRVRYHSAV